MNAEGVALAWGLPGLYRLIAETYGTDEHARDAAADDHECEAQA